MNALPLPFPKYCRSSEIAGAHHERIDGKGKFKGTKGYELSPDLRYYTCRRFKVLTTTDRPYKFPLPLHSQ